SLPETRRVRTLPRRRKAGSPPKARLTRNTADRSPPAQRRRCINIRLEQQGGTEMTPRKVRLGIWSGSLRRAGSTTEQALGRFVLVAVLALLVPRAGQTQAPERLTGSNADTNAAVRPLMIGWRTDGTGRYPKTQPPLEWSTTKNVLWCASMPGYGVSHPVPLGQRIFICSEPATLLCVNRDDGKVLWQKTCSYSE